MCNWSWVAATAKSHSRPARGSQRELLGGSKTRLTQVATEGLGVFLHLIAPDKKFVVQIRSLFEAAAPGRNEYLFVGTPEAGYDLPQGVNALRDPSAFPSVLGGRSDWEGVVVHGLPFQVVRSMVDAIPSVLAIAWYVWGFEAYLYWPPLKRDLLMPETRRVERRLAGPTWRRYLRPWRLASSSGRDMPRVASRYRFCVAPFREEHSLFAATGLLQHTQFHWGSYGSLEDYVDSEAEVAWGEDCQLGNSASFTSNHLDALPLLRGAGQRYRNVVVPLSYGNPRYRDAVVAAGHEQLGERFHPLVDFVSPSEYQDLLQSCGHVVMNHRRQQAWGNILAALWRGADVYLNDTTVYQALRRLGFDARLIQESCSQDGQLALRGFSQAQAERVLSRNRRRAAGKDREPTRQVACCLA